MLKPGFAIDQCGDRWILFERVSYLWALSMGKDLPRIRMVVNGMVETEQENPNFFRKLTQVE